VDRCDFQVDLGRERGDCCAPAVGSYAVTPPSCDPRPYFFCEAHRAALHNDLAPLVNMGWDVEGWNRL
jgi:hypothetical protein